jgi:hypothetical protein
MVLSISHFKHKNHVPLLLLKFAILTSILFSSCRKIGDDDPLISLRSRESRILGKWRVTRLYYFDGNLGGGGGIMMAIHSNTTGNLTQIIPL